MPSLVVPQNTGYGRPAVEPHYDLMVIPRAIPDPGNGGRIAPVTSSVVLLESVMAETRLLSDPLYLGQELDLFFETDIGDIVITTDTGMNQSAHTTLTFAVAGDHIRLVGARGTAGDLAWRELARDGVTPS